MMHVACPSTASHLHNHMKIPATAYVLTRNVAASLPACLASLQDFAEILVVDGNSTDATPDIAHQHGARVIPQSDDPTPNLAIADFSAVRARAFSYATHDWIFQLDADEVLDAAGVTAVRAAVERNDPMVAVRFLRKAVVEGKVVEHAYFYPEYCLRLVNKKSGAYWNPKRRVHERLMLSPGMRVETGAGVIAQAWPDLAACYAKDRRYLDLAVAPLRAGTLDRKKVLRAAFVNIAKGLWVSVKVCSIHLRRLPNRLPLRYHLRFPLYHFRFAVRLFRTALQRGQA